MVSNWLMVSNLFSNHVIISQHNLPLIEFPRRFQGAKEQTKGNKSGK